MREVSGNEYEEVTALAWNWAQVWERQVIYMCDTFWYPTGPCSSTLVRSNWLWNSGFIICFCNCSSVSSSTQPQNYLVICSKQYVVSLFYCINLCLSFLFCRFWILVWPGTQMMKWLGMWLPGGTGLLKSCWTGCITTRQVLHAGVLKHF